MARHSMLVGRARELEELASALDEAERGRGAFILLAGEPGIGKTRLADEIAARARARGARVVWGSAWDGGDAPAFWPWIQVVRELGATPPIVEERDPELVEFRRRDALRALLLAAAMSAPLVVVLDDLHAADRASLLALAFVARTLRAQRVLIVGTYRDAEVRLEPALDALLAHVARDATTLTLERLSRDDVAHLMGELDPVGPDLVDEVYAATGGNPLFTVETVRLVRQGVRGRGLPGSVEAVLRERLARFDANERAALEAAAVLGRDFTPGALAAMLGMDIGAVRERLARPLLAAVIEEQTAGALRFGHALLRDRLLADLPVTTRASLHLAAAEATLRTSPVGVPVEETVARHLIAALPGGDPARAADWAVRAAASSFRALAHDRTVDLTERALAALPADADQRFDLELLLAETLVRLGQGERARAICRAAAKAARDAVRLARAALAFGAELRLGRVDAELVGLLTGALVAVGDGDPGLRAQLLARLAAAEQPAADPRVPIARALEAVALARQTQDPHVLVATLYAAGSALGEYAPAQVRLPLARELARLALVRGDLVHAQRATLRVVVDCVELCDLDEADLGIDTYEQLGRALGHARWRWAGPLARSMCALVRGRWRDAERFQLEAAALVAESDDEAAGTVLGIHRIGAFRAREAGDGRDVIPLARDANQVARSSSLIVQTLVRASIMATFGAEPLAREVMDGLRTAVPAVLVMPLAVTLAGRVAGRIGDRFWAEQALPVLAALDRRALSWGPLGFIWEGPISASVGAVQAVLGRWEQAIVSWENALASCETAGARPAAADARRELAAALIARGRGADRDRAAELLEAAAEEAAALAMPHLAARIAETRSTLGAPPVAPVRPHAFALTREGDIWSIVANGRTARFKHSRAFLILEALVASPGRDLHVLDLGTVGEPGHAIDVGDAGPLLDATALDAYRRRIVDLEEDLAEARRWHDLAREERVGAELELLQHEVARGLGLGGRERRAAGAVERARVNVQKRVRGLVRRIAEELPELGQHLESSIRTGTYVSYRPGSRS